MLNFYLSNSRLYINYGKDIASLVENNGNELIGAGMKRYGKVMGVFLSIIGVASKINFNDDSSFFVNKKSYKKWIYRVSHIEHLKKEDNKCFYKKLQQSYLKGDHNQNYIQKISIDEIEKKLLKERIDNYKLALNDQVLKILGNSDFIRNIELLIIDLKDQEKNVFEKANIVHEFFRCDENMSPLPSYFYERSPDAKSDVLMAAILIKNGELIKLIEIFKLDELDKRVKDLRDQFKNKEADVLDQATHNINLLKNFSENILVP